MHQHRDQAREDFYPIVDVLYRRGQGTPCPYIPQIVGRDGIFAVQHKNRDGHDVIKQFWGTMSPTHTRSAYIVPMPHEL